MVAIAVVVAIIAVLPPGSAEKGEVKKILSAAPSISPVLANQKLAVAQSDKSIAIC